MNELAAIQATTALRPAEYPPPQPRVVETSSAMAPESTALQQRQQQLGQQLQQDFSSAAEQRRQLSAAERVFIAAQRQIQFTIDKETRRPVIKIIDPETKEVIRQIPPEVMLQISRMISRLYPDHGAITDERV